MKITLSKKQEEVVNYKGKHLLVIAGAGSGKTRVLTERIKSLINVIKKGEKVLAITFSNKASDEIRDRLVISLGEDLLNESSYIGTTHRFCLDLVTTHGSLIGLPHNLHICESYDDRLRIFKEAIDRVPQFRSRYITRDSKENIKTIKRVLDELSMEKRNLEFYSDIEDESTRTVFEEYDNLLLDQGVIDFDDILRYAFQILVERPSVAKIYRRIFKYICVDEAQDLNKAQYEVIKALAGDEVGITMVGDPKQAIYGFNGSSSDYFENVFSKEFSVYKILLDENYRSSRKVLEAANKIEKSFDVVGVYPIEGEFEIHEFSNEIEEADFIYSKIKELVFSGHPDVENGVITYNQCAVIARNRYVFTKLEDLFKLNHIEYTLKISAKGSFSSESDLINAFELGMRLIVNPKDRIHFRDLCNLLKTEEVCSNFDELRHVSDISEYWKSLLCILNSAWDILLQNENEIRFHKVIGLFEQFINSDQLCVDEHEKILINGDILLWNENWHSFVRKSSVGERSLGNFIRTVSLGCAYTPDDKGIVLTTVHMAKGLEYDVVFIMGLNEGVFPDYRAVNAAWEGDDKQLIEERHNMFVSITRSKRLCYLTYPMIKDTPWGLKIQRPSRYIEELIR